MGEMSVLSSEGDTKILWDANSPEEIGKAREQFNDLKEKGHTFIEILTNGGQGKEIENFDPIIESILAIPKTRKG